MAHTKGPSSKEMQDGPFMEIDAAIDVASGALRQRPEFADVNLLVLSDHGMADLKSFLHFERLFPS